MSRSPISVFFKLLQSFCLEFCDSVWEIWGFDVSEWVLEKDAAFKSSSKSESKLSENCNISLLALFSIWFSEKEVRVLSNKNFLI